MTKRNWTPLPLIKEVINCLHGSQFFSKMDICWRFNNICIKEGDEEKAVFLTSEGLFKPMVMFFSLTDSPATFQSMMNVILQPLVVKRKVLVYVDNIIIFTKTIEEHQQIIHKVLKILQQNNLYLKPEKCKFEKEEVDYLGVIVSHDKVAVNPTKVKAISEWPQPKKLVEVQEFIGYLNFY